MRFVPLFLFLVFKFNPLISQISACSSTCTGDLGENINTKGSFGVGTANILSSNPNYAPGYSYTTFPPPQDGQYTITNNTTPWGSFASNWIDILDNGPENNGYFMVINADYLPGIFFEQTIAVCENTKYELSVDVANLVNGNLASTHGSPDLTFLVNNQSVCKTGQVPFNEMWNRYRFSFTTMPGQTDVKFSINNNAPGGAGNDLAIDNISFRACGPEFLLPDLAFFCAGKSLQLKADLINSPYTNTVYQWQFGGQLGTTWNDINGANDVNLSVNTPVEGDLYRLIAANAPGNLTLVNCRSVSEPIELDLEDLSGFAIGGTDTIVCNGAPGILKAGDFAKYQWSTGKTSDSTFASTPGWYAVTVTSDRNCTASDSIQVFEARLGAEINFGDPICFGDSTGEIQIINPTDGTGYLSYHLEPSGKTQTTNVFSQIPAGKYVATIFDSLGCKVDFPVVLNDPEQFIINFGEPLRVVACDTISLLYSTNLPPVRYEWKENPNLPCINCPFPVVMPLDSATYFLTVQDALGCTAAGSIFVDVLPNLDVFAPNVLFPEAASLDENRVFQIYPSKSVSLVKRLAVFDRWGGLVFEKNKFTPGDFSAQWKGTHENGKKAVEGTYIWMAELEFLNGQVRVYKGDVLLMR